VVSNVWQFSTRAEYASETLSVVDVKHDSYNTYIVEFEYCWEAYYGCRAMTKSEWISEEVQMEFTNGKVSFDFQIFEELSTDDDL